ncbi:hypothetical protein KFE96_14565 [Kordiimonas sp. SCSIO 12603]|uniref:hypothetical protein n=1 Tax=Kordiimonas sp. SCSIO 12603 TaxID=2829596 RepID=UPI0021034EBA|nr:hypothetical protein [Kordiimonas sp. SCSIO 12603]UTW58031.1 hypothetical protein KFE96_14565 [Kordiimonas sp. SCSIO 12603]
MKKLVIAALMMSASYSGYAQEVSSSDRPNTHTLNCLAQLNRDCAIKAALQTVIEEDFGIQRAKILIGVARSMIATGNTQDAQQTLMLALDEARSVNLSLVTSEKISEIAPLLAKAGDTAGALALVQELSHKTVKDITLLRIAEEAAAAGTFADARVALAQLSNPKRAFWREISLFSRADKETIGAADRITVEEIVRTEEAAELKYRGFIILAIMAEKMGETDLAAKYLLEADEFFQTILGQNMKAFIAADRARAMLEAGLNTQAEDSYAKAIGYAGRLRAKGPHVTFADKIGSVEAASGHLNRAIGRLAYYDDVKEKVRYLKHLKVGQPAEELQTAYNATLDEIAAMDGAYERDVIRLDLMEAAISNQDLVSAKKIVAAVEDDDNQAFALALLAPLVN